MTITPPLEEVRTPIDDYLARQHGATAVERFSEAHDTGSPTGRFGGEQWYTDRVPLSAPGPGEQYAFRVDLDRCSGCKACVAACHSLNGLDEGESWRGVGQLIGRDDTQPRTQSVPTGCHHCIEPACLSGCPTNAYEKDPFTGIVRHLDDQCIGCGYCELTCPYEIPKMNTRLGIVRKCDMCADRLSQGEEPACVQACPTNAISIAIVDQKSVIADTAVGALVPGAPASSITSPTTRYVGGAGLGDDLEAADRHAVRVSHSHPPLAVMLVLTQLSVGAFVTAALGDWWLPGELPATVAAGAAGAGVVALAASVLHLGRPLVAWRAVVGFRHSWLSREIVAFGVYAPAAVAYAVAAATPEVSTGVRAGLAVAGILAGVAGVVCSVMIYVATGRRWWALRFTASKFVLTATGTGPLFIVTLLLASPGQVHTAAVRTLAGLAAASVAVALVGELVLLRRGDQEAETDLGRTAHLLTGPLRISTIWRIALGALGGVAGPILVVIVAADSTRAGAAALAGASATALVCAEIIARRQFFAASVAPRMPGGYRG